uniref:Glycosyl hydrolase family 13 catalytic domain-containing protein n=1 Tax=Schistosoma haematobium TaxID=6185 RepID=A0A094ZWK0_SCHHA
MKTNDGLLFMKRPENPKQITERKKVDLENGEHNYSKNFDKTLTKEEEDATSFSSKLLEHKSQLESRLLTREDLINLDETEPRWRYIRIGLLIGFGIIFFGLLAACIVYIIVGEKCPSVPKLPFWKSTVGYWLDVFAFKDSSGDLVGDLNGLTSEVDYIKTVVGAGYVILGPITKGFYTNSYNMLGLVEDYEQMSRYGKAINVDIGDQKFYSVFGSPNVDLDLTSSETQKAIFDVIHFWMKEGIDGILLDNAAFFVEEEEEEGTQSNLGSTWSENCPNSQLYRNGSVKFVESVREEMNKWIKESGKEKLLAVNSGDTGCGVGDNPDPMLMFRDAADLIISRELVFNRGSSETRVSFSKTSIEKYSTYSDSDREKLGLIASTSNNPTDSDVIQLALTLLLPGQPIIYYGTETGISTMELSLIPEKLYPKGKRYNDEVGFWSTRSHLPMPWDFNGRRFSATINDSSFSDYLDGYSHKETVEIQLAEGNNLSKLHLVKKLVTLHQHHSLKWGTMERISFGEASSDHVEAFVRKAKGFPSFIVVILKQLMEDYLLDLTSVCSSVTSKIIYPSHPHLQVDIPLTTSKIYIPKMDNSNYILVFHCN